MADLAVLWDSVRHAVDMRGSPGQFILTGSAVPADGAVMHTGTGRIAHIKMRPMSLFESLKSNGCVSLGSLFNGSDVEGTSSLEIEDPAFVIPRGGWPASLGNSEGALDYAKDCVEDVVNQDVSRVDGVEKNPDRVHSLMRALARNVSAPAKMKTILDDVASAGVLYPKKHSCPI